jgi:hypothetical protein
LSRRCPSDHDYWTNESGCMTLAKALALRIPRIRRLYDSRNTLIRKQQILQGRLDTCEASVDATASPFFHYNTIFDPQAIIRRHAVPGLIPRVGYLTNYLGVIIDPKFVPTILTQRAGEVEAIPIPANWHADIAEWGAALRAVELASGSFTMIELGCGWGCWMNNTGVAARRRNLDVRLIGVEGDEGHVAFAREACTINGFDKPEVSLYHGIAAAEDGTALFPRQERAGVAWGLEPIFGASGARRDEAIRSGNYDVLPMIKLADLAEPLGRIDLLHMDIQGGETDLITSCLSVLRKKFAYLVIGTHSRQIEGHLFDTLLKAGWRLEIERPAILSINAEGPTVVVDGVQGWRNPMLLPDARCA